MADPVSITASVLTLATTACQAVKSLYGTVERYQGRDRNLQALHGELAQVDNILTSLSKVTFIDESLWSLLAGPIKRCSRICVEFERAMKTFSNGKPKASFMDWAKLEFKRGTITEFTDEIAGYKSTITVGLGIINMHSSRVSQKVLEQYMKMTQDASEDLQLQLQRIDEKLASLSSDDAPSSDVHMDLRDEKAVIRQCLRICQDAKIFIESMLTRQPYVLQEASPINSTDTEQNSFDAQFATRQALVESQGRITEVINRLVNRLEHLVLEDGTGVDEDRKRLQADLNASRQCLEVCKVATEMSRQKIYRVGEVDADGNSDNVVVNTLSDLFDVKKASSTDHSALFVGSITSEDLREVMAMRYNSRFGMATGDSHHTEVGAGRVRIDSSAAGAGAQKPEVASNRRKPFPNEIRKRSMREESEE